MSDPQKVDQKNSPAADFHHPKKHITTFGKYSKFTGNRIENPDKKR